MKGDAKVLLLEQCVSYKDLTARALNKLGVNYKKVNSLDGVRLDKYSVLIIGEIWGEKKGATLGRNRERILAFLRGGGKAATRRRRA